MNLADLRENYTQGGIKASQMLPNPFEQLTEWLEVARDGEIVDSNAMSLATSSAEGIVTSRVVLLKGIVGNKLQFFTNYNSRKAQDIAKNPNCSVNFHWKELERQICIRGTVKKTSREVSQDYFASRPYDSKIGAWVSEKQSDQISVRSYLRKREDELRKRFPEEGEVPCPDFWGGFEIKPTYLEFWQGRQGRLHDRLRYRKATENWLLERLSP